MQQFIVVSHEQAFRDKWRQVLEPKGRVFELGDVAALSRLSGCALAVLDLDQPGYPGAARLAELRAAYPGTRLIVCGQTRTRQTEIESLSRGASACCDPRQPAEELGRIVDVALNGGVWISREVVPVVLKRLQALSERHAEHATETHTAPPVPQVSLDSLTEREREVAQRVAQGASNKQIARDMNISDRTVKAHLSNIFAKLQVSDRLQLAVRLSRQGEAVPGK